ncbi:hypothetical protein EPUS_08638 [Endocarpon pusillum Z07020]|uniref:Uncharacterized protein n=1 Tax=Endocarpon pusillum (strain Z07020 / HMAS-L-300199) TaxID=1263415 RepID=U1GCD9_ENDPU|nr:uncharacterized protein EPUS_08638 [Endocarpon pusillum Z07020]ERF69366.1 hypothetical protein EPUS_08638 [Endocarpon pusillum Z07020]
MRLLQVDENGKFSLTDDLIHNIPPYAILSHTWGEDYEEVSFIDLTRGLRRTKAGYKKLRFCAKQAARDGLQYFWVDTCCINKENNTELSEAITSMYRWYNRATKCYTYLSDVSIIDDNHLSPSLQQWESAFRNSRWFTRGWTLQELLAPPSVEFFCSKGTRLGDKRSLEQQIHEITRIPVLALQGAPLAKFDIDERMSWAKMRQTKRGEDKAYSLLGLFDVSMPLIYGEGEEKAFRRLQREIRGDNPLDRLPYAIEAPFNSFTRQHEPACLTNTRVNLLNDIYAWVDGKDERCIFWLNGMAGTGKSTIARTVARRYYEQQRLAASFFFSKGGGDVSHAGLFITSIAMQVAQNVPASRQYIRNAVAERNDIASQSLRDQWQWLVLCPLLKLDEHSDKSAYVLVVDALDECDNENNIRIIIHLLAEARSLKMTRLRIFLTSRSEIPIRNGFRQISDAEHRDYLLHDISPSIVDHDLSIFFEYNLKLIGQEQSLDACWPGEEITKRLIQTAGGLFIWAATACRFIHEGKRFAVRRLDTILSGINSALIAPEKHLDEIYTTVLKQSIILEFTKEEKEEVYCALRKALGSIVILLSPLSASSLCKLLGVKKEDLDQTLNDMHSVLEIPKNRFQPLRLHHPSFRDYLLSKSRCQDPNFWVNEKQAHQVLADNCLRLMSISLKQDICGLNAPGKLITEVDRSRIDHNFPPEVQYACLYWIEHVQKSSAQLCDDDQVHHFLQKHLLHWLEALGWMGKMSEGVYAIAALQSFATSDDCPHLSNFIYDAKRFVLYNRSIIEQAPIQTYCSALIFVPTTSIVRKQFADCMPGWIEMLPRTEENWNVMLQTLEGHSGPVFAVAFSPDGKTLASGSDDRMVKLWDARSGAADAVAFSPDGKTLASGSRDYTVKLWDAGSGAVLQTLEGHSSLVVAVAFSPGGKTLASGSYDNTVKLWDAGSGAVLQTLKGHSSWVNVVAFSPDGKTLASGSDDRMVKLWDARSGAVLQTLEGHSSWVNVVAFSPDGKTLASGSDDRMVKLWDARSGAVLQTLEGHSSWVNVVAFSPDGKTLASGSDDRMVKLWDARSGAVLQTLEGHSSWVNVVAFSPDGKTLASGSDDRMVKLWDARSGAVLQTLEGHSSSVVAVAFSPDGKTLASGSYDKTVKLWDAGSGGVLQTFDIGYTTNSISFSDDSTSLLTNRGILPLSPFLSNRTAFLPPQISPSVFVKDQWVSLYTDRILWLPPEHRPSCVAVFGNVVGLGHKSGRVTLMTFNV